MWGQGTCLTTRIRVVALHAVLSGGTAVPHTALPTPPRTQALASSAIIGRQAVAAHSGISTGADVGTAKERSKGTGCVIGSMALTSSTTAFGHDIAVHPLLPLGACFSVRSAASTRAATVAGVGVGEASRIIKIRAMASGLFFLRSPIEVGGAASAGAHTIAAKGLPSSAIRVHVRASYYVVSKYIARVEAAVFPRAGDVAAPVGSGRARRAIYVGALVCGVASVDNASDANGDTSRRRQLQRHRVLAIIRPTGNGRPERSARRGNWSLAVFVPDHDHSRGDLFRNWLAKCF
mmetsp:Transcript_64693/g.179995  ORF Transcript_64693/g.179995 Transcript_64693/m.179995 type:complete len:292 (-) Transcript_64693:235-1110(-)